MSATAEPGFNVVSERANETVEVAVSVTVRATQVCISTMVMQYLRCVEFQRSSEEHKTT